MVSSSRSGKLAAGLGTPRGAGMAAQEVQGGAPCAAVKASVCLNCSPHRGGIRQKPVRFTAAALTVVALCLSIADFTAAQFFW